MFSWHGCFFFYSCFYPFVLGGAGIDGISSTTRTQGAQKSKNIHQLCRGVKTGFLEVLWTDEVGEALEIMEIFRSGYKMSVTLPGHGPAPVLQGASSSSSPTQLAP